MKTMCQTGLILILALSLMTSPILAAVPQQNETDDFETALSDYFNRRYAMFQTGTFADFSDLVAETTAGENFYRREREKLVLELWQARFYNLTHLSSSYWFTITAVSISENGNRAELTLVEGHDVVFKTSTPVVSEMRNLEHTITLLKQNENWKIENDNYADHLHKVLTYGGMTAAEIKERLSGTIELTPPAANYDPRNYPAPVYQRSTAVQYALTWGTSQPPYHPDYMDFSLLGGDCTNFVSQAILFAAPGSMTNPGGPQIGSPGWYYHNPEDRAIAWTWVDGLYDFITNDYKFFRGGPQGYETTASALLPGDIIQYNWGSDPIWDHSVIITKTVDQDGTPYHLVTGHTPDVVNYPYPAFNYGGMRFLHISAVDMPAIFLKYQPF